MKHLQSYKLFESDDPYTELKDIIFSRCQQFVGLSKSCESPLELWRGVSEKFIRKNGKEVGKLIYEINHQKDRKPTDTPSVLHDKLNKEFEKKFGWPVRNGIFCIPDRGVASSYASISSDKVDEFDYAEPYFFIPIGDFKYCWSPKYHDLTVDIKVNRYNWKTEMESLSDTKIKNIVNSYKESDISEANYSYGKDPHEISFYCEKYLLISQRYFIKKGSDFWNW